MREPLFILSPPRSFSSLISSIIGQHPEIHAFPELQIFGRESLLDMMLRNQEHLNRLATPGAIRSIAEVHENVQTNESCARAWLWIQKHAYMTPVEFFDYLRNQIDPMVAVEKSPIYTLSASRLQQIIMAYPNAKFLHLTRSVIGNQKSLKEYLGEKDKVLNREDSNRFDAGSFAREYPASVWYASHRNILTVMPFIKPGHYLRIKGEDILNHPFKTLNQFCHWMEIDSSKSCIQSMLRPHESPYAFVGPRIAHGGNDNKFMEQPVLRLKQLKVSNVESFRETTDLLRSNFDNRSLFRKFPELTKQDSVDIDKFMNHLCQEIQAMQVRLGY